MAATAPNQKVVHVNRQKCDKNFLQISKENWYAVNKDLGPYGLQLYLYLAGNKKTTYHSYVKTLIAKGYLVPRKENSNIYDFYEIPKREEDKRAVPSSELDSLPHELSSLPDEQNSLQGGLTGSQPNKEIYNKDKIYNINQIIKDSTQDGNFVF